MTEHPLDRTVLLIQRDLLPRRSASEIIDGLCSLRVRLRADRATLATVSGQTALVTAFVASAQLGARLVLDVADDLPVLGRQDPVAPGDLAQGLLAVSRELIQPAVREGEADMTFVFGDTESEAAALRCAGGLCSASVTSDDAATPWPPGAVIGPLLGGAMVAAEVFRKAGARLAGHDMIATHALTFAPAHIALDDVSIAASLGAVDIVSGGAITTAALFALLRVPDVRGRLRIIDADVATITNLNRYPLMTRNWLEMAKVDALAALSDGAFDLSGVPLRYDEQTVDALGPLAPRVLVGVDDIPSRWLVQRHAPGWLCVAGTSHLELRVSEHVPGAPCAGCEHPHAEANGDADIPTVSFVSLFAGILQAHRLLRHVAGHEALPSATLWPLSLRRPRALVYLPTARHPRCPVGCRPAAS